MAKKNKEYTVERSPFYKPNEKLRATLSELQASDGEDIVMAKKRYFKQDEYTKLIINKEFNITEIYKLSNMAKTILFYILYDCLEFNQPTFRFRAIDFALMLGKTDPSSIFKGINVLINVKYIAKTKSKEIYWINHNAFYKGNFMTDKYLITKT